MIQFMGGFLGMNYQELIEEYTNDIKNIIIKNDLGSDDIDTLDKLMREQLIGDRNVIITYKAKQLVEAIGHYDAFDTNEETGERFSDWSDLAYKNLMVLVRDEIDMDVLLNEFGVEK